MMANDGKRPGWWQRDRCERGQVLVEMALMGLVLALLLAGLLDLWEAYYTYIAVTDAATEGASYGAVYPNSPVDHIQLRAVGAAGGMVTILPSQVTVISDTHTITVTVSHPHALKMPFMQALAGDVLTITQQAAEPILNLN